MGPIAQKFFAPDGSWQTGCEDDGIAANKFAKMLKLTGAQITAHCTEAGRLTSYGRKSMRSPPLSSSTRR
jgi:hypothetical protein